MLVSSLPLLALLLPVFGRPTPRDPPSARSVVAKRSPGWLLDAEIANWACVPTGSNEKPERVINGEMQLQKCQEALVDDAVNAAVAHFPGANAFALRTDLGIGYYVPAGVVARELFHSSRWNGDGRNDYDIIVFHGPGTLDLNGRTLGHERGWAGNAEEKDGKVVFS